MRAPASGAVTSSGSALPPCRSATRSQGVGRLRHVQAQHVCAVPREDRGDGLTDAACRACHQRGARLGRPAAGAPPGPTSTT
jgi:hypothetical protein